MRGRTVVSGLLVMVLLSTNFVSGAGQTSTATAERPFLPAEHMMSFTFDALAAKVIYSGQQWDSLRLSGCEGVSSPGTPDIPARTLRLELPNPLAKASVSFGDPVRYENVRLVPAGATGTDGTGSSGTGPASIDNASYRKDMLVPAVGHQVVSLGQGVNGAGQRFYAYDIILYPLRYNPAKGEALLYQKCEVRLFYDDTPRMLPAQRAAATDQSYIVLTGTAVNNSGALDQLMTWKTRKGLPAFSYDVNDIYANYSGRDDAEKIRNFLMTMYDGGNGSVRWVQIIGDTDTVPTREVPNPNPIAPFDDGWIATDAYYSCIDKGTTWDKNNNTIFGELLDINHDGIYDYTDLDDVFPDVSVARFASSDIAKVTTWVGNAVAYEMGTNSGPWMNSCTLVAPNAGSLGTAAQVLTLMEQFVNKTGGFGGYLGPYYGKLISNGAINRLYEANGTLSGTSFVNSLNGGYALGTWIAQGDDNSVSSATPSVGTIFSSANVAGLTNGADKPVIFAVSGESGRFDGQECLGEALTESNLANGAMAFIGPSRTTTASSNPGYWDNLNATGLLMDFLYALQLGRTTNANDLYVGETFLLAKYFFACDTSYMNEAPFKAFLEYNLLGEVNCPIWTDTPGMISTITVVSEDASYKNVSFRVLNAAITKPMNHALVCLRESDFSYYQAVETLDDGYANFSIPKAMSFGDITVTRADFAPFEYDQLPLADIYAPFTGINITPPLPDGKNGWYNTTPKVLLLPEPGSTTYFHLDSDADQPYSAGQCITIPEGVHHLYYHSVDWIGLHEGERDQPFSVDSSIPYTNITITPAAPDGNNGWYISQPLVTLQGFDNTSNPSVKFKMDSDTDFIGYEVPLLITEGPHTLSYYSVDQAGNAEAQHTINFKVDITPPTSIATVSPLRNDGLHGWYIKAPTISFTISPSDENGPAITYWWDNGAPTNLTNVTTGGTLTPPQGIHTLYFQAVDEAGNLENIQNLTIKLDSFIPVTNITADPAAPDGLKGWYVSRPSLTLDAGENSTTLYRWDQDSYANVSGPLRAPEGTNTLSYYSVDDAGNKEMVRLAVYKVDTVVPATNITVTPADKGDQWYTKRPTVRLNNSENATMFYYWGADVSGMQNYTGPFTVPDGKQLLHFWAMDEAGNKEQERTKEFWVDTVTPLPTIAPSATSVTEGGSVIFSLGGTDSNGIQYYYVDFGDGNNTGWVQLLTVNHTYTVAGNYTVICRARDPAGNEGGAGTLIIEVKATYVPPVVKPGESKSGTNLLLIGAIAAICIVVGIVAVVAVRSRKRGAGKDDFYLDQKKEAEKKALMPAYDFGTKEGEGAAGMAGAGAVAEPAFAGAAAAAPESPLPSTPGTFNCPKCGNEVEVGADYCYTCGERFTKKGGGPGGSPPGQPQYQEAPRQTAYAPPQREAPAYAPPTQDAGQHSQPSATEGGTGAADHGKAPAQPAYAYEAPARPAHAAPAQRPAGGTGNLADIMNRLESISKPAATAQVTQPRPPAATPQQRAVQTPPPPRAAQPSWSQPAAAPAAPAAAAASAETATGKSCPKCGAEMVRLVDLPGAQGEQLRKLNAKGQHAFQCRNCNNFLVAPWNPPM